MRILFGKRNSDCDWTLILEMIRTSIAGLKPKVTKETKRHPRRLEKKSLLIARLKQNRNAKVTKHGKTSPYKRKVARLRDTNKKGKTYVCDN